MNARVIVVGAGFAGAMAAHDLQAAGVDVVLLEARDRIGGRVRSHRFEDGVVAELGAELIEDWYALMLGVATGRGLGFTPGPQRIRRFPFFDRGQRAMVPDDEILAEVTAALGRLKVLVAGADDPANRAAAAIDAMTVKDGLDVIGLEGVPRRWFEALISGWSCREPEEESLLHFSLRRALPQLAVGLAEPRHGRRLVGGNIQVAEILLEPLGDRLHLGSVVRRLDWSRGRVEVTYEAGSHTRRITGGRCVLALPAAPLRAIQMAPALPVGRGGNPALLDGWGAKAVLRHPYELSPDPVFLSREPRFHGWQSGDRLAAGSSTLYVGGAFARQLALAPAAEAGRLARSWLAQAYPDIAAATQEVVVAGWCRDSLTVSCGPAYPPGLLTTAAETSFEPVGETLFFAGEHTSPDHFGSMEGALETGRRAAAEVLGAIA